MPRIDDHADHIFDRHQGLQMAGGPLRVYEGGPATGRPPILLLHGAMFDRAELSWLHVANALAASERVVAVDLPRHGGSRPWVGVLNQSRLEQVVLALLDELGLDRVVLVGLSLGGAISLGLSLHHPERVAGAVLINPGGIGDRLAHHRLTWVYTHLPGLDRLTARVFSGADAMLERSLAAAFQRGRDTPGFERLLELTKAEANARAEGGERAMDDWQHAVIGPSRLTINFARAAGFDTGSFVPQEPCSTNVPVGEAGFDTGSFVPQEPCSTNVPVGEAQPGTAAARRLSRARRLRREGAPAPDRVEAGGGVPLAGMTRPTVWLHGSADPLVSRAEIDAAVAATPGARLVVVEGAQHVLTLDQPEVVVREVRALADRLAAGLEVPTDVVAPPTDRPSDPGMTTKMGPKSPLGICALSRGERIDESTFTPLLQFVDARIDCADFRLVVLLKALLAYGDLLSEETRAAIGRTALGFRYWMDEPGTDGMCHWSENHQILFAVAEHLAGAHFAEEVFGNGMTGAERRDRARVRIDRWLDQRFRYGFIEWLSNTYYEEDVAALSVLIDHTDDANLRTRATMIMDLIMLDLAMHRFGGRFVGTSGRCYELQKKDPASADVNQILDHAFGGKDDASGIDEESLSVVFRLGDYRVPEVIKQIAADPSAVTIRQSVGLDLSEVDAEFADADPLHEKAMFLWAMEAFTNPESINSSTAVLEAWPAMRGNTFISALAPFVPLRRTGLLPGLVRTLNPATQGVAIQRADILTRRTEHWLLSSAQRHHPGAFGDQQHLWQATLPGDLTVFATHPARPMFDDNARNFSPSAWVGNGIMPDVAQHESVLIARYDTRRRPGLLERGRLRLSHLHWPRGRFDETIESAHRLAGRAGDSLIGVLALRPVRDGSADEIVQNGADTAWAVVCGDTGTDGSLAEFSAFLDLCTLGHEPGGLRLQLPVGHRQRPEDRRPTRYELHAGGPWLVDAEEVSTDFDRYDTGWISSARRPSAMRVAHGDHDLAWDWTNGTREER